MMVCVYTSLDPGLVHGCSPDTPHRFAGDGRDTVGPGRLRVKTRTSSQRAQEQPDMRKNLAEYRTCT